MTQPSNRLAMTIPAPWDKPQLRSVEAAAVAQASTVANAMLDNETDADPLSIKKRANAAIHLCDERNWPEARREFAYVSICCEFRWAEENPRQPLGINQHDGEGLQGANPVPPHTATRMHDAYDGAEPEDIRVAKDAADAKGEAVHRGHVRKAIEAPSDGVQRRATGAGERAKAKREAAMNDHQALLQETLEGTAARAHAAESELAARVGDPETRDDAMEELALSNKTLFQVVEDRAKQIADLREKLKVSEGQVAFWENLCDGN